MKLRHLFESNVNDEIEAKAIQLAAMIKSKCSATLSQISLDAPLYRGIKTAPNGESFFLRPIRTERRPAASDLQSHRAWSEYLKSQGATALRDNSAFATGNDEQLTYGTPYVIFPLGEIFFTWSPAVSDAYARVDLEVYNSIIHDKGRLVSFLREHPVFENKFKEVKSLAQEEFESLHDNKQAMDIVKDNGPMSGLTAYVYYLSHEMTRTGKYLSDLQDTLYRATFNGFLELAYPIFTEKDSKLSDAIASYNEVMINSSEMKVLYVTKEFYFRYLKKELESQ